MDGQNPVFHAATSHAEQRQVFRILSGSEQALSHLETNRATRTVILAVILYLQKWLFVEVGQERSRRDSLHKQHKQH